jgi:hypothetical protein
MDLANGPLAASKGIIAVACFDLASFREKGRVPRAASTCGKQYLRPAAVTAGVISKGDKSRFVGTICATLWPRSLAQTMSIRR